MKRKHLLYGLLGLFFTFVLVFLGKVAYDNYQYRQLLLSEGLRVQAQVIDKEKVQTSKKKKIIHSYLYLAVFENMKGELEKKEVDLSQIDDINDKIDALFENQVALTPIGDYVKVQTDVALHNYAAYEIGDWLTFVYLEGEVHKGKILDELE